MSHINDPQDAEVAEAAQLHSRLKYLAVFGACVAICAITLYLFMFHDGLSDDPGRWGQFGDYLGGVLNPVFSFLALIALLATFALQVRELRMSARELKNSADALLKQNETLAKQNFEATFFQLLRLHNDIVGAIDLVGNGHVTRGRDCFNVFRKRLDTLLNSAGARSDFEAFLKTYNEFYSSHQHELGHYFRLLYNIVKLVKQTPGLDKRFYTNLIRAQLSSPELMLIFYNCLSTFGAEKFKPLVEEFALLKTMPRDNLPDSVLMSKYSKSAFGGEYPTPLT